MSRSMDDGIFNITDLDEEERELIEKLESSAEEWVPVDSGELQRIRKIAQQDLERRTRKGEWINFRINMEDLTLLEAKALRLGIPYQTLLSQLVHRYVRQ